MSTFGLTGFCQTENDSIVAPLYEDTEIITYIETAPKFPGGVDSKLPLSSTFPSFQYSILPPS